jgi:hypothetical protein
MGESCIYGESMGERSWSSHSAPGPGSVIEAEARDKAEVWNEENILKILARSHTENIENITKFMFESFLNFSIPASMNDIEA